MFAIRTSREVGVLNNSKGVVSYITLSFHEANILVENIRNDEQSDLIVRLGALLQNTEDLILLSELQNLTAKVQSLTKEEFNLLYKDTLNRKVLFPPNYLLLFRSI